MKSFSSILLLALVALFLVSPQAVQAETTSVQGKDASQANWNRFLQVSDLLGSQIPSAGLCAFGGGSPLGCSGIQLDSNGQPKTLVYDRFVPGGGVIGGLTTLTTAMYSSPPTSSSYFLAKLGDELGIVQPAYAQVSGSGASIIQPVEKLWRVMRNIGYLIYIVIFIVVGFMIMLRQKLNPQTVITIQAAIPGLVIGLILLTFSYFISALVADLSFVGMQVVGQVFTEVKVEPGSAAYLNAFNPQELAQRSNVFELFTAATSRLNPFDATKEPAGIAGAVTGTLNSQPSTPNNFLGIPLGQLPLPGLIFGIMAGIVALIITGPLSLLVALPAAAGAGAGGAAAGTTILGGFVGLIVPFILVIALAIQMFRLFMQLLNSYIMILVTTILGPFFIVIGSVPGREKTIEFWWKNLLGHSLSFPAVFATFLFAGMILATPGEDWKASPPFFGGLSIELLRLMIAYGIILGTPAVPAIVKKAIGAQDLGAIGTAGIAGFAAGAAPYGKIVNPYMEARKEYAGRKSKRIVESIGQNTAMSGGNWYSRGLKNFSNLVVTNSTKPIKMDSWGRTPEEVEAAGATARPRAVQDTNP